MRCLLLFSFLLALCGCVRREPTGLVLHSQTGKLVLREGQGTLKLEGLFRLVDYLSSRGPRRLGSLPEEEGVVQWNRSFQKKPAKATLLFLEDEQTLSIPLIITSVDKIAEDGYLFTVKSGMKGLTDATYTFSPCTLFIDSQSQSSLN